MASINTDIELVRTAIFGKDVREAIADGLSQMKNMVENITFTVAKNPGSDNEYTLIISA